MNEFERRQIEVAQNHVDLNTAVRSLGYSAIIEHFGYSVQLGSQAAPLLNGVTNTAIIPMQADAYFVLQYISTCVIRPDILTFFQNSGNINMQITDTGSGNVLYSSLGPAGLAAGTALLAQPGVPLLLPVPRIILPNTNVKIDAVQNGVNVTDNKEPVQFWVSLIGSRVARV